MLFLSSSFCAYHIRQTAVKSRMCEVFIQQMGPLNWTGGCFIFAQPSPLMQMDHPAAIRQTMSHVRFKQCLSNSSISSGPGCFVVTE